jgi:hypothetical protein
MLWTNRSDAPVLARVLSDFRWQVSHVQGRAWQVGPRETSFGLIDRRPTLTFLEKITSRREHPKSRLLDIGLLAFRQFIPGRPCAMHTDPTLRQHGIQVSGVEPQCSSKMVLFIIGRAITP